MQICNENETYLNLIPYLLREIALKFQINHIYEDKIENFEQFVQIHKACIKGNYKDIAYYTSPKYLENEYSEKILSSYTKNYNLIFNNNEMFPTNFSESNRKRIDKENKLIILKRKNFNKNISLEKLWGPIQDNILRNFIKFYQRINNQKL